MKKLLFACILYTIVFPTSAFTDEVKKRIEEPVEKAIAILQKTQKNEEDWRQLQEKLTSELELLQARVAALTKTREQQREHISHAKKRISTKEQQLADVLRIELEMDPFLNHLVDQLATLPEEGLPFLQKERKERIANLKLLLSDPDIPISEQYRKTMEALQIEAEYGITLETYQEMLANDDEKTLVNILRLGKLGLYYVTLDESHCGFYNIADNQWQPLSDDYIFPIQTAVAIASKRRPAEFIDMPLGRMVK